MNLSLHTYSDLKLFQDETHTTIIYTKEGRNLRQRNPSTTCNQTSTQSCPNSVEFHQTQLSTQLSTFSFVSFSEVHNPMVSHDQFSCQSNTQLPCQNSTVYHAPNPTKIFTIQNAVSIQTFHVYLFQQFPCFLRIFFFLNTLLLPKKSKKKRKKKKSKKKRRGKS